MRDLSRSQGRALRLAIVGFGPRGLAAAEYALAAMPSCRIEIFDPSAFPAAGPNFAPAESPHCLLNLRASDVNLPSPVLQRFPSFSAWVAQAAEQDVSPDDYPSRRSLGDYLTLRYDTLKQAFPDALTHHRGAAPRAWKDVQGWWIATHGHEAGPFDEVLLTLGQPSSKADPTWEDWRARAASCNVALSAAYPGHALQAKAADWAGKTVAVRGLGLSTLDVVAILSLGQGGRLEHGRYIRSGQEPASILPFSLDGMPPLPKPDLATEPRFTMTDNESNALRNTFECALSLPPDTAMEQITQALAAPLQRQTGQDPSDWLARECASAGAQDMSRAPIEMLREGIEMASGQRPASVGYCTGQIWRALQHDLRAVFQRCDSRADTRAVILGFDRGLKRMSYGPPLSSARLLLALVQEGLVQLSVADDPDVTLSDAGWRLQGRATAQVMVDAVLPAPRLEVIEDPLIRTLLRDEVLREDPTTGGIAVDRAGRAAQGLSVLGRLTEGRSIATDSLHDCYGAMTRAWAGALADAQDQGAARGVWESSQC